MKIRPATMLPEQSHLHWKAPDEPGRIRPVTMTQPAHMPYRPGQAYGGLWTASPNAHSSNACVDLAAINALRNPRPYARLHLWRLTPDPDATLVVVEDTDDYHELCQRYPYHRGGIDVSQLLANYDGLHVTGDAAIAARSASIVRDERDLQLGMWVYESTFWRRFAFVACELIPLDSAAYSLHDLTYSPAMIADRQLPANPALCRVVLADLECRNRAALDAVAPVMRWLRQRQTQEARAGPLVAAR